MLPTLSFNSTFTKIPIILITDKINMYISLFSDINRINFISKLMHELEPQLYRFSSKVGNRYMRQNIVETLKHTWLKKVEDTPPFRVLKEPPSG